MTYNHRRKLTNMNTLILVALGSAIGGLLRYIISNSVHLVLGRAFPYGTLVVNLLGCFCMGLLFVLILEKFQNAAAALKPFLLIGLLGGFTTFSAFAIETLNLLESSDFIRAFINFSISTLGCLSTTWFGLLLGKILFK